MRAGSLPHGGAGRMTVGKWILNKVNTKDWRIGKVTGHKHYSHSSNRSAGANDPLYEMRDAAGGRAAFLEQVRRLEKEGLITVIYENVNTDVKKITVSMEQIDRLYEFEGLENPRRVIAGKRKFLEQQRKLAAEPWLLEYYEALERKLDGGTVPDNLEDENIFLILTAMTRLEKDIWERKFSAEVLGDSKLFENHYEKKILTVLRKYSPKAEECMEDVEILAEHKIRTYSQMLEWKGGIVYRLEDALIDTSASVYGTVLNAQTLEHAALVSLRDVKKIVTIENKANYESMKYSPDTLYLYTHGFPSPKERIFLANLEKLADEAVEFFHWSDMDYGGIRIFQYLKKNLFTRLRPLGMDRKAYEKLLNSKNGIPLEDGKREKLEKMDAGELEELKRCILQHGMEFEQENML